MLRVKYERYWNDFHRRNEVKHFADLDELAEWMFGQMQQDYTRGMSFPTPEKASRIGESGPWAIELRPVWGGENLWIHQIENSCGIIFSDGKLTSGQKHWSQAVKEWLVRYDERRCSPKFNFVG